MPPAAQPDPLPHPAHSSVTPDGRIDIRGHQVVLCVLNTDMKGWVLVAPRGHNILGREPHCSVHLPHHTISRHHCSLHVLDDAIELTDLNSMNGTFVNGVLVSEARLRPGDHLRAGEVDLSVETRPNPSGPGHPPPPPPIPVPPTPLPFQTPPDPSAHTVRYRELKQTIPFDRARRDAFRQFRPR